MIDTITKCDTCGKVKGEANHWLLDRPFFSRNDDGDYYGLSLWAEGGTDSAEHFCGHECAIKRMNAHLGGK